MSDKADDTRAHRVIIDGGKFWREYEDGERVRITLGNFKSFASVTEYMRRRRSENGR